MLFHVCITGLVPQLYNGCITMIAIMISTTSKSLHGPNESHLRSESAPPLPKHEATYTRSSYVQHVPATVLLPHTFVAFFSIIAAFSKACLIINQYIHSK